MGRFVNPDNSAFQVALNSEIYVDKTGLLEYTNRVMNTNQAMICNSRPRRFGKSITANMLAAYYSKGCDSKKMFEGLAISKSESFAKYLNQYDVIHFDVQWCINPAGGAEHVVSYIQQNAIDELRQVYPKEVSPTINSLPGVMSSINAATGRKFIVIIDEWDVLIRDEAANQIILESYIDFLRGIFKGTEPTKYISLVYMTGILPIKKVRTQSALNNFDEFTMLDAKIFAPYIGFTEDEVKLLCEKYQKNFDEVKQWYDGYLLSGCQVYNPKAVVSVMTWGNFQSYWSQTGTYESIMPLISMDFDGLKTAIIRMTAGEHVKVKTTTYQNDMITFKSKDDVLTLLIHLGYLAYDSVNRTAFIPNEEIRSELTDAVESERWNEFMELQIKSEELVKATLDMDCEAVAQTVEFMHSEYASVIAYHDENALSSILSIAYLGAMRYYFKPVRELPTGRGFADLIFFPKKEYPEMPALLVELKWNQSAETAIQQIKNRKYTQVLEEYTGRILLVGINYNKKSKRHECIIEKFEKMRTDS
ncbi:AAA family ATPase [Lachnospiraceae bacterium 38-10]